MSERYTKLFELPPNLYTDGAPVIVSAGALYLDNKSGKCVVQLKIKNISESEIKAVSVKIVPFDVASRQIEPSKMFQYLDLDVTRDEEFGPKILIEIENSAVRSFKVEITEIVFVNNEIWSVISDDWSSIPTPKALEETISDEQAIEQYRFEFGRDAILGYDFSDLWVCACGRINHSNEKSCHHCGNDHAFIIPVDIESLKKRSDERKAMEEREKIEKEAQAEAEKEKRKKKIIKACIIGVPIILILCVLLTVFVFIPNSRLESAHKVCSQGLDKVVTEAWGTIDDYILVSQTEFCKSKTITYSKEKISGNSFHCEGKAIFTGDYLYGTLYVTIDFSCDGNAKEGTGTISVIDANAEIK